MYLVELFSEPESINDPFLDNFFMKNKNDIPTSKLPLDKIMSDIKHEKYNRCVNMMKVWP